MLDMLGLMIWEGLVLPLGMMYTPSRELAVTASPAGSFTVPEIACPEETELPESAIVRLRLFTVDPPLEKATTRVFEPLLRVARLAEGIVAVQEPLVACNVAATAARESKLRETESTVSGL
jgi:hypothetical protein